MMQSSRGLAPTLKYTSATTVVAASGTSLVAYMPTSSLNNRPPIRGGLSVVNWGVNGNGIGGARSNAATKEDTSFNGAKQNVLVFWGATNTIWGENATGAQAYAQANLYCQERLAVHPEWKIILVTEIPRYENIAQATVNSKNAEILAYNALLRANYRAMGAAQLADLRYSNSPFNLPDYGYSTFTTIDSLWDAGTANYRVHLSTLGYTSIVFPCISAALRRVGR